MRLATLAVQQVLGEKTQCRALGRGQRVLAVGVCQAIAPIHLLSIGAIGAGLARQFSLQKSRRSRLWVVGPRGGTARFGVHMRLLAGLLGCPPSFAARYPTRWPSLPPQYRHDTVTGFHFRLEDLEDGWAVSVGSRDSEVAR